MWASVPLSRGPAAVCNLPQQLLSSHLPACLPVRLCTCPACQQDDSEVTVHLGLPWCDDVRIAAGDTANIIGGVASAGADGTTHVYLSHTQGLFVLHPDVLLSGEAGSTLIKLFADCCWLMLSAEHVAADCQAAMHARMPSDLMQRHVCQSAQAAAPASLQLLPADCAVYNTRGRCIAAPLHRLRHRAGTTITTAVTCTRRAWLSERFAAAGGGPSSAALCGTLLHELLQRLLLQLGGTAAGATQVPDQQQLQAMVRPARTPAVLTCILLA